MEVVDALQKRNTDCVYFLASPLTCKKGIDCEYRHSEVARLNPRDCWYWLSGNCLNPTCGFRHPPLEKPAEAPSDSALLTYESSVSANTASIPCYFYFSRFCNKGERCFFSHGLNGNIPAGKSVKTSSVATEPPVDDKMAVGSDTATTKTDGHHKQSETASLATLDVKCQPKKDAQQRAPKKLTHQNLSPQIAVTRSDEVAVLKSDSLVATQGFIRSRSQIYMDQSPENQVDDLVLPEDRWESSPGFDVLVDDRLENLGVEDDEEYLPAIGREQRKLNNHFSTYDIEAPTEYETMYPERERYDSYGRVDDIHVFDDDGEDSGSAGDRMFVSPLYRKRKHLPMELSFNDQNHVDLRQCLAKRRVIDGPFTPSSRGHKSSLLLGRSQERLQRHGIRRWLHGRLASQVGKIATESRRDDRMGSTSMSQHGRRRHSESIRFRQHHKVKELSKRPFCSPEVPRKSLSRKSRSSEAYTAFTGPKTLAQIKEEKEKAEEKGNLVWKMRHSNALMSPDFEGPKPLSEILKYKRRLCSLSDGN